MPLDTSIALGVQPPQVQAFNPSAMMDMQAQMEQRRSVAGLNALRGQLLQQEMSKNALAMQGQGLTNQKTSAEIKGVLSDNDLKKINATKAQLEQTDALISRAGSPEAVLATFDNPTVASAIKTIGGDPSKSKQDFATMLENPAYGPDPLTRFNNAKMHMSSGIMATQKHLSDMTSAQATQTTLEPDVTGQLMAVNKATATGVPVTQANGAPVITVPKGQLTQAQMLNEKRSAGNDYNTATDALRNIQDVSRTVDNLEKSDLSGVTGYASKLPSFGEKSLKAESQIETLKGKMTALGKTLSASTGKLGNLAVQEYQMLRDQVANFDPYKGEAATRQQLADIKASMQRIENGVRDVYTRTYGGADNPFTQFRELPKDIGSGGGNAPAGFEGWTIKEK
jgi:hypothetical protein